MHCGIDCSRSGTNMPDLDLFQIWNCARTDKHLTCGHIIYPAQDTNKNWCLVSCYVIEQNPNDPKSTRKCIQSNIIIKGFTSTQRDYCCFGRKIQVAFDNFVKHICLP